MALARNVTYSGKMISHKRFAKIITTLGPSSSNKKQIKKLVNAGADVFRLNFSHGTQKEQARRYKIIREVEHEVGKPIGVIIDLQGPKIRVATFSKKIVELEKGASFMLDGDWASQGTESRVAITNPEVIEVLDPGMELLLDDGKIKLEVVQGGTNSVKTVVRIGGVLTNHKGLNIPGTILPISSLTTKDISDLKFGLALGVDWVALSFVQSPEDISQARRLVNDQAGILAKIEKPSAINHLSEIVRLSDAIMVARGDLGVEALPEEVPGLQKRIIQAARSAGKPVIVATQMLESMIAAPTPTRAEASDVANAIFEGADAIMLSAETAIGRYPIESVKMMKRIIERVELDENYNLISDTDCNPGLDADAITAAARQVAQSIGASLIVTYTETGSTTLRASKVRPEVPILALTPSLETARRLVLAWGVNPLQTHDLSNFDDLIFHTSETVVREGLAKPGEKIVVTAGMPFSTPGTTNILHIIKV